MRSFGKNFLISSACGAAFIALIGQGADQAYAACVTNNSQCQVSDGLTHTPSGMAFTSGECGSFCTKC